MVDFVFEDYYLSTNQFDVFLTEKEHNAPLTLVAMDAGSEFELSKEEIIVLVEDLVKND